MIDSAAFLVPSSAVGQEWAYVFRVVVAVPASRDSGAVEPQANGVRSSGVGGDMDVATAIAATFRQSSTRHSKRPATTTVPFSITPTECRRPAAIGCQPR